MDALKKENKDLKNGLEREVVKLGQTLQDTVISNCIVNFVISLQGKFRFNRDAF